MCELICNMCLDFQLCVLETSVVAQIFLFKSESQVKMKAPEDYGNTVELLEVPSIGL